jgi:type I restriction enzyme S subunit
MAKQLYDYWFVQFDFPDENGRPYKSSGDKMVWNERLKREIPENWQVVNLVDFAEIKNGATPSTSDDANYGGDVIWITPKDLSDQQSKFIYQGQRNITEKGYNSCSTNLLPIDSILLSSRAPIGLVSIAKHELCTNQGFKNLVPVDIADCNYLYYYIRHHIKQIEQLGTGTTFKEVSREDLCGFPILKVGNNDLYKQWVSTTKDIFDKQLLLTKEIAVLTKQRDELLPLLMNGQVSVTQPAVNCDLLDVLVKIKRVLSSSNYSADVNNLKLAKPRWGS